MASKLRPSPSEPPAGDPVTDADPVVDDEELGGHVLEPIVRTARPVRPRAASLHAGPELGRAARGAAGMARHLDVALSRRTDRSTSGPGSGSVPMPWGVWPSREDPTDDDRAAVLGAALASYARLLRARRGAPPPPPARGIPLVARRGGGTAGGPARGPGGLARSMVPVDQPIAAAPATPRPTPPRSGRAPATLTPRRPGGR